MLVMNALPEHLFLFTIAKFERGPVLMSGFSSSVSNAFFYHICSISTAITILHPKRMWVVIL